MTHRLIELGKKKEKKRTSEYEMACPHMLADSREFHCIFRATVSPIQGHSSLVYKAHLISLHNDLGHVSNKQN